MAVVVVDWVDLERVDSVDSHEIKIMTTYTYLSTIFITVVVVVTEYS